MQPRIKVMHGVGGGGGGGGGVGRYDHIQFDQCARRQRQSCSHKVHTYMNLRCSTTTSTQVDPSGQSSTVRRRGDRTMTMTHVLLIRDPTAPTLNLESEWMNE